MMFGRIERQISESLEVAAAIKAPPSVLRVQRREKGNIWKGLKYQSTLWMKIQDHRPLVCCSQSRNHADVTAQWGVATAACILYP